MGISGTRVWGNIKPTADTLFVDQKYFGVSDGLNMRAAARNFRIEDIPEIHAICRQAGIKLAVGS